MDMRRIGRFGAVTLSLGLFVAIGCVPTQNASAQRQREQEVRWEFPASCYLEPSDRLSAALERAGSSEIDRATRCADTPPRRRGDLYEQIANANYHAGRALRIQASELIDPVNPSQTTGSNDQAQRLLDESIILLRNAENQRDQRLDVVPYARLELARAYRLKAQYEEAETVLSRNVAGVDPAAVTFERAMLRYARIPSPASDNRDEVRRMRSDVAGDLEIFANPTASRDWYVRQRGPRQLADIANILGVEYMNLPTSGWAQERDNLNQAVDLLDSAKGALTNGLPEAERDRGSLELSRIAGNLGRAQLRLAGLLTQPNAQYVECGYTAPGPEVDRADIRRAGDLLERAGANFVIARQAFPATANWGEACVALSRASAPSDAAINQLRTAAGQELPADDARNGLTRSEIYVALGRALARRNLNNGVCNAQITNADCAFQLALNDAPAQRRVQILIARARLYSTSNPSLARQYLQQALEIAPDPQGQNAVQRADAQLELAQLLFSSEASVADLNEARANLVEAVRARDWPGLGQGYALLSRIQQERHRRQVARVPIGDDADRPVDRATAAIANADNAVFYGANSGPVLLEDYRRRACLVRIYFHQTDGAEGQCLPRQSESAEWQLYYGMYWFAEADRTTGSERRNNWGRALRAFELGQRNLRGNPQLPGQSIYIGRALDYGRRTMRTCAGLEAANEGAQLTPEAAAYFAASGIRGLGC